MLNIECGFTPRCPLSVRVLVPRAAVSAAGSACRFVRSVPAPTAASLLKPISSSLGTLSGYMRPARARAPREPRLGRNRPITKPPRRVAEPMRPPPAPMPPPPPMPLADASDAPPPAPPPRAPGHLFSQLWCPWALMQEPASSLFVYTGADVDVTLLRLLHDNERSVGASPGLNPSTSG